MAVNIDQNKPQEAGSKRFLNSFKLSVKIMAFSILGMLPVLFFFASYALIQFLGCIKDPFYLIDSRNKDVLSKEYEVNRFYRFLSEIVLNGWSGHWFMVVLCVNYVGIPTRFMAVAYLSIVVVSLMFHVYSWVLKESVISLALFIMVHPFLIYILLKMTCSKPSKVPKLFLYQFIIMVIGALSQWVFVFVHDNAQNLFYAVIFPLLQECTRLIAFSVGWEANTIAREGTMDSVIKPKQSQVWALCSWVQYVWVYIFRMSIANSGNFRKGALFIVYNGLIEGAVRLSVQTRYKLIKGAISRLNPNKVLPGRADSDEIEIKDPNNEVEFYSLILISRMVVENGATFGSATALICSSFHVLTWPYPLFSNPERDEIQDAFQSGKNIWYQEILLLVLLQLFVTITIDTISIFHESKWFPLQAKWKDLPKRYWLIFLVISLFSFYTTRNILLMQFKVQVSNCESNDLCECILSSNKTLSDLDVDKHEWITGEYCLYISANASATPV